MNRLLVVTNDFPPRPGGIQAYVYSFLRRLPAEAVVVYAPSWRGAAEFDRELPFPVVRESGTLLLPVPGVARRARQLARAEGCGAVWFGAAAPLGLLAQGLRRAGVERVVASTHGHEIGWLRLPVGGSLFRRIAGAVDVLTYVSEYTHVRLRAALSRHADKLVHLPPGVDTELFRPDTGRAALRERLGLGGRPVVVCVSRLMARKGQDTLVRALPEVLRAVPEAALLLVGGGPARSRLARLARSARVSEQVLFTGSVPWQELPAHYAAGDVFAMPCRSRLAGFDVEGLGIVYLEAAASGLPVLAGDSGGAPDAVLDGRTGWVVGGRSASAVAARLVELLRDGGLRRRMGEEGRSWVQREWRWEDRVSRLADLLQL